MDMDRPADAALRIQCAADAALRIQCAARRRLAVHRASNALKLVVRARWGPLEGGACEAVLDTTRPAFPVVLLSADHPSIGRGHVVMPLAALVRAAQRLSVAPHSASSSSPAFSPPLLERVKSNSALRRLAPNNTACTYSILKSSQGSEEFAGGHQAGEGIKSSERTLCTEMFEARACLRITE